jgi:hypothetical protein
MHTLNTHTHTHTRTSEPGDSSAAVYQSAYACRLNAEDTR